MKSNCDFACFVMLLSGFFLITIGFEIGSMVGYGKGKGYGKGTGYGKSKGDVGAGGEDRYWYSDNYVNVPDFPRAEQKGPAGNQRMKSLVDAWLGEDVDAHIMMTASQSSVVHDATITTTKAHTYKAPWEDEIKEEGASFDTHVVISSFQAATPTAASATAVVVSSPGMMMMTVFLGIVFAILL